MNILIPHKWLLEHLETAATPKEIQDHTSLCGPSVERIYEREGDAVYDIEVTTNRVDSMSVRGIAREVAVILEQFGIQAMLKPLPEYSAQQPESNANQLQLPKIHNNPTLSKRVLCVVLDNIQRVETPDWMATRLTQTDQNVHDAAIDITNYITHELGHPCHAFDYHKLMQSGGEIHVVEAQAGEQFTTLDGANFTTVGGEVVFKDAQGNIIDLPSIKGTLNTSVDKNTTTILLLLESIVAQKVRFASMTHAIRTTAAQLMEKNTDPHLAELVLHRGIELYSSICKAQQVSPIFDEFSGKAEPKKVTLALSDCKRYLGLELPKERIQTILEKLECGVTMTDTHVEVTPPTFRPDLCIPADIIEEIARIYGYHNLPSVLMDTPLPNSPQQGTNFALEHKIKRFLAAIGLQEVYSYSMVSEALAKQVDDPEKHLKLANPLTDDRVYLRKSLVPSLIEVLEQNTITGCKSVFELAHVYLPQPTGLPEQKLLLSMVSSQNHQEVLAILGALLNQAFVQKWHIAQHTETSGEIVVLHEEQPHTIGTIAVLHGQYTTITIEWGALLRVAKTHPEYQSKPKTAVITEDMTFTLQPKTAVGSVIATMLATDALITKVSFNNSYQQNYSFALQYNNPKQNVTNADIEPIRKKIAQAVLEQHGGALVGTL